MRRAINRKWLIIYSLILIALAAVLPGFHLILPIGSPDFGMTPVTVSAVLLPWPVAVVAGFVKSVAAAFWGGNTFLELSAGLGDILMALLTAWMVRRMNQHLAAVLGQLSRFILTGGTVAVIIGLLVAYGVISPGLSPVGNLTTSAWQNIVIIWKTISYPVIALSIGVNMAASLLLVWLFSDIFDITLYKM